MGSQPRAFQLGQTPLTSHSFNSTRDHVAVSLNSQDATIFAFDGSEWKQEEVLSEHDKLITSIDWGHLTNRIITCSQDRNAYVWSEVQDPQTGRLTWKPTLVLLRINRAATFVRWSPKEDKFAVASGDRAIAVCSFDVENDWWVAKHLKKPIRSTVLSIDWHPNNILLAAGSADNKARVLSAYIKDIDKRPPPTVWGEKLPFNTLCGEFRSSSGGWVHSVGFSPSGDALAFASHDSSITVVYPATGGTFNVRTPNLPFVTLVWTSEQALVAAGHDYQPVMFQGDATNGWFMGRSLDDASTRSASTLSPTATGSSSRSTGIGRLNNEAFSRFKNADSRGPPSGLGGSSHGGRDHALIYSEHQNTITSVRPFITDGDGTVSSVSTSGVDGRLVIWGVPTTILPAAQLTTKLGGLHLR